MSHTDNQSSTELLARAVDLLLTGKLVAIPTETVYGLAADATNSAAVQKIYAAKGRPSNNPLILHFPSLESALPFINWEECENPGRSLSLIQTLSYHFWPGPLTLVVPRGRGICDEVCAGGSTIAIRIPNHPLTLQLLSTLQRPLAAPSANPSGYISPTTATHVQESLGEVVDMIIDGGACSIGVESTVLSLITATPTLLRPGAITIEQLEAATGVRISSYSEPEGSIRESTDALLSPGLLSKHYAPRTPIVLLSSLSYDSQLPPNRGVILFSDKSLPFASSHQIQLSTSGNLIEIAQRLFGALRELDSLALDIIVVDTCEPNGLGLAIMDRLLRASSPF